MKPIVLAAAAAVLVAGCGGGPARIKGKVVENGQPVTVTGQASLVFYPTGPEGKAGDKAYAAGLNPDGTFELVASGGQVPAGPYLVSLEVSGGKESDGKKAGPTPGLAKYRDGFKSVRRELKSGENNLTIDLAKPNE